MPDDIILPREMTSVVACDATPCNVLSSPFVRTGGA